MTRSRHAARIESDGMRSMAAVPRAERRVKGGLRTERTDGAASESGRPVAVDDTVAGPISEARNLDVLSHYVIAQTAV